MTDLFFYAIKSAFVLALLYLPYTLLLRRERFFRLNRLTLLAVLVLSVVLPLCNIPALSLDAQPVVHAAQRQMIEVGIPVMLVGDEAVMPQHTQGVLSWFSVVSIVYIVGMLAVLILRLMQFVRLGKEIRGGALWRQEQDGICIYCHADNVAPFSWLRNIVISLQDYEANGREIILHERGHILCHHSLDILLLTFVQMLQWWNPLAYLLGISLRDVHEYEADHYVLSQGVSLRDYQTLLIRKAVGASSYTFANSFNHSLIKNRITMMCKKDSSPWMQGKVLYVIPMVGIALCAFATPKFVTPIEDAVRSMDPDASSLHVAGKGKYNSPIDQQNGEISARDALADSTLQVGVEPFSQETLPADAVVLLDGKEVSPQVLSQVPVASIAHVSVLRGESAKLLLKRPTNSVVVVETKDYVQNQQTGVVDKCDVMPVYEGGVDQLMQMFMMNLRYPKAAMERGVQGRVLVQFVVEKDGGVSDVHVLANTGKEPDTHPGNSTTPNVTVNTLSPKDNGQPLTDEQGSQVVDGEVQDGTIAPDIASACEALDEEAMRVVRLTSGKWTPGVKDGHEVRTRFVVPITFRLN